MNLVEANSKKNTIVDQYIDQSKTKVDTLRNLKFSLKFKNFKFLNISLFKGYFTILQSYV